MYLVYYVLYIKIRKSAIQFIEKVIQYRNVNLATIKNIIKIK